LFFPAVSFERSTRIAGFALVLSGGAVLDRLAGGPPVPRHEVGWLGQGGWARAFEAMGPAASLAADVLWLRLHRAWERRDESAVRALIALTLAAEPRSDYFRLNAVRMVAYDFPAWRRHEHPSAPAAVEEAWRQRMAQEAMALLEGSQDPVHLIEAANLTLYGRRDRAAAAVLYRRAAERPDAPWHAGRIYAQLLREMGRDPEALEWLRAWLPRLPGDDPAAQRALVELRIADLELELRSRGEPL
jgi:hypothetical protein